MVCVSLHSIREIAQSYQDMEQELAHAVNASSKSMDKVYAKSKSTEVLLGSLFLKLCHNFVTVFCFVLVCFSETPFPLAI